jgi:hypothetical protein
MEDADAFHAGLEAAVAAASDPGDVLLKVTFTYIHGSSCGGICVYSPTPATVNWGVSEIAGFEY